MREFRSLFPYRTLPQVAAVLGIFGMLVETTEAAPQLKPWFQDGLYEDPNGVSLAYWLYVPKGASGRKPLPVATVLHGSADRGSDNRQIHSANPVRMFVWDPHWSNQYEPTIVLVPQCPNNKMWFEPDVREAVINLIDEVRLNHRGDPLRLYLAGFSLGGIAAYDYAANAPDKFAAVCPIAGYYDPKLAPKMTDTPIYVWHGAKDKIVPVARAREMVQALKKAGAKIEYHEAPGLSHQQSVSAVQRNNDVRRWIYRQRKGDDRGSKQQIRRATLP